MKKVLGFGCLVLALVGLVFFTNTGCFAEADKAAKQDEALTQAKEKVDPNTWDFGEVKKGEVASHSFTLKNDSDKTLNITGVNTSCGCTVSEVKKKVLLPQESTPVEVKFNSKNYLGNVQQFVYVNTDRLDNPIIRFIIKANVVK